MDVIHAQLDALDLMVHAVQSGRALTASFIKELHAAITRHQLTYRARDQFGSLVERPLQRGTWKEAPNEAVRSDGTSLQFVPPEQVPGQIDRLLELYEQTQDAHSVVRSAWLHHQFVRIHPFQDGNGRVARALTLMVLLKARYAPLVVPGNQREDYIAALDKANDGDLRPLVRLFAGLELVALKSEISVPVSQGSRATGALPVARELVSRLSSRRRADHKQRVADTEALATAVHHMVIEELQRLSRELETEFRRVDPAARTSVSYAAPGNPRAHYWHGQIVFTAQRVDFFAELHDGCWWTHLRVSALGQSLRYLVFVQKVGRGNSGILAVTPFAEVVDDTPDNDRADSVEGHRRAFVPTPKDSVTLVHTNSAEERWPEAAELIDRTLAAGLRFFVDQLS